MYHPDDKVDVFPGDVKRREDPLSTGAVHPAFRRRVTDDSEGLIPVTPVDFKIFYVVDCPSLHLVDTLNLFPDRSQPGSDFELITFESIKRCPRCAGAYRKTRRIPISDEAERQISPAQYQSSRPHEHGRHPSVSSTGMSMTRVGSPTPTYISHSHNLSSTSISNMRQGYQQSPSNLAFAAAPPYPSSTMAMPPSTSSSKDHNSLSGASQRRGTMRSDSSISTDTSTKDSEEKRASTARFSIKGLISPRGKTKRPSKHDKIREEKSTEAAALPTSLSFCFSASGQSILMWRRNGHCIIRIDIPARSSDSLPVFNKIDDQEEGDKSVNLKLVAEGHHWIATIVYHKQSFFLLMMDSTGNNYSMTPLPASARPISLSISRDNAYVAVGYGHVVQLFHYQECARLWSNDLRLSHFRTPDEVRFQLVNFSPDGKYLIVGTQKFDKRRGSQDNGVWIRVWRCEEYPGLGTPMGFCFMPTDHLGITSVLFDPTLNKSFITGMVNTPYALFHTTSISEGGPGQDPMKCQKPICKPSAFKVRCATQCPSSMEGCFMTATNKLYRINMKTQDTPLWKDFSQLRGRLDPKDEPVAISMPMEGMAYIAWKEGAKFWMVEMSSEDVELDKVDLRWLIDQAGWTDP